MVIFHVKTRIQDYIISQHYLIAKGIRHKDCLKFHQCVALLLFAAMLLVHVSSESKQGTQPKFISAPQKNVRINVIDGTGKEAGFHVQETLRLTDDKKSGESRVSVSTVALFTLVMAAATGLGAVPLFFAELDPEWAGICNGMAAGVMLAASFDLIQEGQQHGSGFWVVIGILSGGIFILLCKELLERCGEVSMLDIKGADATKAVLVIGIMTLHSFGEGSGVGVSFAGSKGFSQGLLVTLARSHRENRVEHIYINMIYSGHSFWLALFATSIDCISVFFCNFWAYAKIST